MKKKSIQILTDYGSSYGIGHYIRCTDIQGELIKRGYNVKIIKSSENKINNTCDLYIIDLPYDMSGFIEKYIKKKSKVLTLEYFKTSAVPDLNISVLDFPVEMRSKNTSSSLNYIIIRNEIRSAKNDLRSNLDYGIIMLGGSLNLKLLKKILSKINDLNKPIKIIVNHHQNIPKVDNKNIEILVNPDDLPELMNRCTWCVTNGGITMLEMIYLQKNIFVFPQTETEIRLAKIMLKEMLILSINPHIIDNSNNNIPKSLKSNKVFDGLGSIRIADKIDSLLYEV